MEEDVNDNTSKADNMTRSTEANLDHSYFTSYFVIIGLLAIGLTVVLCTVFSLHHFLCHAKTDLEIL